MLVTTHVKKRLQGLLPSDWAEKHKSFLAPAIRKQNGLDRLELVW